MTDKHETRLHRREFLMMKIRAFPAVSLFVALVGELA